ncbi:MAG: hypothetical protein AABX70_08315 [Nanoarchaeota archaeon]
MKKIILATILTLFLALPFSMADKMYIGFPGSTSSPMVKVPTPQARYLNTQDVNRIREGMPVLVYGQLPQNQGNEEVTIPQNQLFIDENGVLVNPLGNPVIVGTTGYSFANGYDWTTLYPWNRYGNYFTSNLRGFKAGVAQTNKLKDYGGRTWGVYMYGGYGPAQAVIKQWYKPRTETTGYYNPGISKLITTQPAYVRPGIPGSPLPSQEKVTITQKIQQAAEKTEAVSDDEITSDKTTSDDDLKDLDLN